MWQSITRNLTAAYFKVEKLRTVGRKGTHSNSNIIKFDNMNVEILPALKDNYMYLIIDNATKQAAVVDPVEPDSVIEAVKNANVNLTTVLTTHHHWDHAGGNENIVKKIKNLRVCGGDERIDAVTQIVSQNDSLNIGELKVTCIETPCHTSGHICYFIKAPNGETAVFTGDTLFQGGCGRFFEGTASQMYVALCEKLASLPNETKVFCGHEYTLQNLAFARQVEPTNDNVVKRIEWATSKRSENLPTVPSTIGEEKSWNPFMRVEEPNIQKYARSTEPIKTMEIIRKMKDSFVY